MFLQDPVFLELFTLVSLPLQVIDLIMLQLGGLLPILHIFFNACLSVQNLLICLVDLVLTLLDGLPLLPYHCLLLLADFVVDFVSLGTLIHDRGILYLLLERLKLFQLSHLADYFVQVVQFFGILASLDAKLILITLQMIHSLIELGCSSLVYICPLLGTFLTPC